MQVRAVVALVLVHHELPVEVHDVGVAAHQPQLVEARHLGAHVLLEAGVGLAQGLGVEIEIDEHHVGHGLDPDLAEAEILEPESGHVLGVAGRPQRAEGVVGPGVERAGDDGLAALALEQDVPPVHADVVVGAQVPGLVADDEHLLVDDAVGDVVAGIAQVLEEAEVLPGLEPDLLLLALVDPGVVVVVRGQRQRMVGIGRVALGTRQGGGDRHGVLSGLLDGRRLPQPGGSIQAPRPSR